jgi:phenylalanyl-tRNA synthetase alpha chain
LCAAARQSGSVSALLKTLGSMMPDERKVQGPAINGLKDRVGAAIAAASDTLAARTRCQAHQRDR